MGRWILRGVRRGAGERRDGRGVSRAAILALAAGSRPVRGRSGSPVGPGWLLWRSGWTVRSVWAPVGVTSSGKSLPDGVGVLLGLGGGVRAAFRVAGRCPRAFRGTVGVRGGAGTRLPRRVVLGE